MLGLPLSLQLHGPMRTRVRAEVFQTKNTQPGFQNSSHKAFHSNLIYASDSLGGKERDVLL